MFGNQEMRVCAGKQLELRWSILTQAADKCIGTQQR